VVNLKQPHRVKREVEQKGGQRGLQAKSVMAWSVVDAKVMLMMLGLKRVRGNDNDCGEYVETCATERGQLKGMEGGGPRLHFG
jgi:hypothetical protein